MGRFDSLLLQSDGRDKIEMGRDMLALGMAILDPSVSTKSIEPQVHSFLGKNEAFVDKKLNGLEAHLNTYTSAMRELEKKLDVQELKRKELKDKGDNLMAAQASIVTPEMAKQPSEQVLEVSATYEGDPEAAKLYGDRDQPRKPGEVMPGNTFTQFEQAGIKLSFENVGMEATRLSAQEASLLEGLY